MNRIYLSLLVAFCGSVASQASGDGPKPLEPKAFFEAVTGEYRIQRVGGVFSFPTPANSAAAVEIDGDEAFLSMPFCRPILLTCDPGLLSVPLSSVQVMQDGDRYAITVNRGDRVDRYSWRVRGDRAYFRNYQYRLGSRVIVLEHVLRKVSREDGDGQDASETP